MFKKLAKLGACAAAVISLAGMARHAAAQTDEPQLDSRAGELLKACDTNKDGSVSWQELLTRDRDRAKSLRNAKKRAERDKVRAKYERMISRDQFLFADSDDDFALSASEIEAMLDSPTIMYHDEEAPRLGGKALEALAAANVEDQWDALVAEIDRDKNKKLSKRELEIHFIFYGDDPDTEEGMGPEAIDPEVNITKSFAAADKNGDKQLVKSEYPEFVALEFRRNNLDYIEYFVNEEVADNPLGVVAGSTTFARYKEGKDWQYVLETFDRIGSKVSRGVRYLNYTSREFDADVKKKVTGKPSGFSAFTWDPTEVAKHDVEKIKVAAGTFECVVEETTRPVRRVVGGQAKIVDAKVKTWHLKDFYGIVAQREEDGEVMYELMELKTE